jgi:hypothetical protein
VAARPWKQSMSQPRFGNRDDPRVKGESRASSSLVRARRPLKSGREPTRSTTRTSVRPPKPKSRHTTWAREVRRPRKLTTGRHIEEFVASLERPPRIVIIVKASTPSGPDTAARSGLTEALR